MPIPRSEVQSIIAQIRAGNNDPELIANALEAIVSNSPYGSGYYELVGSFISGPVPNTASLFVLKNTFPFDWVFESGDLSSFSITCVQDPQEILLKHPYFSNMSRYTFSPFWGDGFSIAGASSLLLAYSREESGFTEEYATFIFGNLSLQQGELIPWPVADPAWFSLKFWLP